MQEADRADGDLNYPVLGANGSPVFKAILALSSNGKVKLAVQLDESGEHHAAFELEGPEAQQVYATLNAFAGPQA